ncbi:hypothetical protein, partial [uncultured Ruminococcus sp.]|uniref:hypothetical protein n=1 Tax=uncultured Ruminococcus sp. TaxID=165186 RepID=UPI002586146A
VVYCRCSSTTYLLGYFRMFSNPLQDAGLFDGYLIIYAKIPLSLLFHKQEQVKQLLSLIVAYHQLMQ